MGLRTLGIIEKGQRRVISSVATSDGRPASGSEAGSYLRLIDLCITQLKAQGPSRTCNESKEEEGRPVSVPEVGGACDVHRVPEVADEGHERERPALPPYGALYALHSAIYTLFY